MSDNFTFWSDLQGVNLSEETNLQWVHALSVGNYKHPSYGTLDFTPERIQRFADSVKQRVRGIDPDIDYDHKRDSTKGNVAAGWVKDADVRQDGLWLLVEWTDQAKKEIKDKKYRYFSTEFVKEWVNEKGEQFRDVVLGGGLTNRPFLKNLVPVNLNELYDEENQMDRAELARVLGLSEDASDDDIKSKIQELNDAKTPEVDLTKLDVKVDEQGKIVVTHPDIDEAVWEGDAPKAQEPTSEEKELEKLAETNPTVARILSEQQSMKETMRALEANARLSEVTTQLSELGTDTNKALPPVVSNKFRDIMVKLPKQLSDEVADAVKELIKVGPITLGELSSKSKSGVKPDGTDAISQYLSEVDKVKEEKKVSTKDASVIVQEQQPKLFSDYLDAIEAGQQLTEQEA